MAEARRKALAARQGAGGEPAEPQVVDTLDGRMHVRWDEGAASTPHGQLVFFAEFLAATGATSDRPCLHQRCRRLGNSRIQV